MASTLVLLPGLDGTGEQFAPFIAALGGGVDFIVVRYPSRGALDLDSHEAAVRSALPADRPFILLGESFSGPIAIRIAASAPAGLVGLILCASFARFPRPALRALKPIALLATMAPTPIWCAAQFVLGTSATPPSRSLLSTTLRRTDTGALRARLRILFELDARDALGRVGVPILYLRAKRDRVVPRANANDIAAVAPGTVIVDIDAPHFLLQAVPIEAAGVVRQFVEARKVSS